MRLDSPRSHQLGFTLLEVLLAIMITALIGLGSWQLLNSAIRTDELTNARQQKLAALQRTMLILERDFQQTIARSIRDGYGDPRPAIMTRDEFYEIEFSRLGWRNPLGDKRSNIQRVAYELDQNELIRHYWNVLDRAQDSESVHRTLLKDVEKFSLRFMNNSGGWSDEWPPEGDEAKVDPLEKYNQLPKAIELLVTTAAFGEIRRLFELPQYMPQAAFPEKKNDETGDEG